MSEKSKRTISLVVGIVGLIIVAVAVYIFFWPSIASGSFFEKLRAMDQSQIFPFAVICAIGIVMASLGFGAHIRIGRKSMKEGIASFVNPILQSKGKVSLRQIAEYSKWNIESAMGLNALESVIKEMIGAGYFEDARLEGGWLIKDVIACPYCSEPVKLTDKKCPNCGATIKK